MKLTSSTALSSSSAMAENEKTTLSEDGIEHKLHKILFKDESKMSSLIIHLLNLPPKAHLCEVALE